jgi:hypothetical protein
MVDEMRRALSGQGFEVGPLPVEKVQDQELAEHQLGPVAKIRPQLPQALRYLMGQAGQDIVRASWRIRGLLGIDDQVSLGWPGL